MTRRRALFSLFAVLLLLVQSHGLWHQHDADEHDHDHDYHCVFCMELAPLDHGLSMAIQSPVFFSEFVAIAPDPAITSTIYVSILAYSSRAPPAPTFS